MSIRVLALTLGYLIVFAFNHDVEHLYAQDGTTGDVEAGRTHFKSGVDFYRDGDLGAALIEFKRAYSAAPNYRVLYNLGHVSNELREYAEAQRYFQRYLSDGAGEIEPERKREVESALGKISKRIATVVVSCDVEGAELFVDDVSVGKSPLVDPVRVSAGTRRVAAAISGKTRVTQVVEAAGGDTLVVKLKCASATTHEEAHPAPQQPTPEALAQSSDPGPALWIGLGTGALAVGSGVMAYLAARDAVAYHDALRRKTTASELSGLHDRAATKALVTDILLGATAVSAVVTLIVALQSGSSQERAPETERAAEPRAQLSVGAGSLQLSGRFD